MSDSEDLVINATQPSYGTISGSQSSALPLQKHADEHRSELSANNSEATRMNSVSLSEARDDTSLVSNAVAQTRTATNMESLMNLLKGNVGTGILALPAAFKHGGLWVGFAGIFIIGGIALHCMHLLLKCAHRLYDRTGQSSLSYGEVMKESFRIGPEWMKLPTIANWIINIFLCITQFGFCTVYILFVASNIKQVVEEYTTVRWNIRLYEFFVYILLIPYMLIRNLKVLSKFSAVANIFMVIGLILTLVYCWQDLPSIYTRPAFASWSTLPLYFGIAIYAFEGIGVVLPIENKMKNPQDFGGWTGVVNLGMTIAIALYVAVGFFGYLRFGDDVRGSITLNLPSDQWLYCMVKILFAVAIFCTYAVQFYVPVQIIWPPLEQKLSPGSLERMYGEYILRIVFVTMTFLLAIIIPCLDLVISLIGALSSCAVALIFPPILEIVNFWSVAQGLGKYQWRLIKDILIIVLGILGFIAGTVTTLINIVDAVKHDACDNG